MSSWDFLSIGFTNGKNDKLKKTIRDEERDLRLYICYTYRKVGCYEILSFIRPSYRSETI